MLTGIMKVTLNLKKIDPTEVSNYFAVSLKNVSLD